MLSQIVDVVMRNELIQYETASLRKQLKQFRFIRIFGLKRTKYNYCQAVQYFAPKYYL